MPKKKTVVTLRAVAERVGLAPCSVSAVLNRTPASRSIPQPTKDRIFHAAKQMQYRPNLSARALRTQRTHMVAVISNDLGRTGTGQVVAGMERLLRGRGYLLALGALDRPSEWTSLSLQLYQRGIEGVIAIGVSLPRELTLPGVSVHLGCLNLNQSTGRIAAEEWLAELGESAAEALLSKIEAKSTRSRARVVLKLPYSDFPFSSTGLGISVDSAPQGRATLQA